MNYRESNTHNYGLYYVKLAIIYAASFSSVFGACACDSDTGQLGKSSEEEVETSRYYLALPRQSLGEDDTDEIVVTDEVTLGPQEKILSKNANIYAMNNKQGNFALYKISGMFSYPYHNVLEGGISSSSDLTLSGYRSTHGDQSNDVMTLILGTRGITIVSTSHTDYLVGYYLILDRDETLKLVKMEANPFNLTIIWQASEDGEEHVEIPLDEDDDIYTDYAELWAELFYDFFSSTENQSLPWGLLIKSLEEYIPLLNHADDMREIFGTTIGASELGTLLQNTLEDSDTEHLQELLEWLPDLRIFNPNNSYIEDYDGAEFFDREPRLQGAYKDHTIYISNELFSPLHEDAREIVIQELGHHIHHKLSSDGNIKGGEGVLAATYLCDNENFNNLTPGQLAALRRHIDYADITLDLLDETVTLENAELGFWNVRNVLIVVGVSLQVAAMVALSGGTGTPEAVEAASLELEALTATEEGTESVAAILEGTNDAADALEYVQTTEEATTPYLVDDFEVQQELIDKDIESATKVADMTEASTECHDFACRILGAPSITYILEGRPFTQPAEYYTEGMGWNIIRSMGDFQEFLAAKIEEVGGQTVSTSVVNYQAGEPILEGDYVALMQNGRIIHSGVFSEVDSGVNYVTSKLGRAGIYRMTIDDCVRYYEATGYGVLRVSPVSSP